MSLMFISGHQVGLGSHTAEYVLGWKKVMQIIVNVFENEIRMESIASSLNTLISKWAKEGWMGRGKKQINFNLKISEEKFFPPPRGQMKQIKIQFFDELVTSVKFYIRRKFDKTAALTLRHIALSKLCLIVNTAESVDFLELPKNLSSELKSEIVSCWKMRYLTDLKRAEKTKKSYCEEFNDTRNSWRARTFDDKDRFKLPF